MEDDRLVVFPAVIGVGPLVGEVPVVLYGKEADHLSALDGRDSDGSGDGGRLCVGGVELCAKEGEVWACVDLKGAVKEGSRGDVEALVPLCRDEGKGLAVADGDAVLPDPVAGDDSPPGALAALCEADGKALCLESGSLGLDHGEEAV